MATCADVSVLFGIASIHLLAIPLSMGKRHTVLRKIKQHHGASGDIFILQQQNWAFGADVIRWWAFFVCSLSIVFEELWVECRARLLLFYQAELRCSVVTVVYPRKIRIDFAGAQ